MMDKKDILKISGENADEICSKIKEDSFREEQLLLDKANKEKERILSEAVKEAERQTSACLFVAENEIARIRERIFSIVTMEKKRIFLEGKSLFVTDVFAAVKQEAENFRRNKDYAKFLKEAILEGIEIVGSSNAQVFYSYLDEGAISLVKDLPVEFKNSTFSEIGVIVQSQDGRLLFDNRFSARLKRSYDEIYMNLLKEVF
jgi:vacuolar-type H+-ATPase subunit E/Vma4